jgi:hypothetical protein
MRSTWMVPNTWQGCWWGWSKLITVHIKIIAFEYQIGSQNHRKKVPWYFVIHSLKNYLFSCPHNFLLLYGLSLSRNTDLHYISWIYKNTTTFLTLSWQSLPEVVNLPAIGILWIFF